MFNVFFKVAADVASKIIITKCLSFFLSGIDGIFKLHCAFLSRIVGDFLSRINGPTLRLKKTINTT
jgi:hypothetical protein